MNPRKQYTANLSSSSSYIGSPTFKAPAAPTIQNKSPLSVPSQAWQTLGATKTVQNPTGTLMTKKPTTTPSDTSATGTVGTKITSPAGQQYISTIAQSTPTMPSAPQVAPSTTSPSTESYKDTPDYQAYLKFQREKENPTEASDTRKSYEASLQRLADIQSQREKADYEARKGVGDILDMSGGLKGGTRAGAGVYQRRSTDDLADLALQESAAARSADVALEAYTPEREQQINDAKQLSIEEATTLGVPLGTTYGQAKALGKVPTATKEGFSLGKDQTRYEYDAATGQYKAIGGGGSDTSGAAYERGADPVVDAYVAGIRSGTFKPSDVPSEYQNAVAVGLSQADKTQVSETGKEMIGIIDELLGNTALAGVTGPIQQLRPDILTGGEGILAKNQIDQLIATLKLDNRQKLKGSGAISDFEFKVLGQASTAINKNLPYTQLSSELQKLKDKLTGNAPLPTTPTNGDVWKAPDGAEYEYQNGVWESFSEVGNTTVSIPQSSRLAYVNNNPGNLRFAGQEGATQGEGGFARFNSPEAGVQALERQIKLDASRGLTLAQFINKYAPPSENDTQKYVQDMVAWTGASPLTPLSAIDINTLTKAVARKESSTNIA